MTDYWERRWAQEEEVYAAVTDASVLAVLDVLAPRRDPHGRLPIVEWGHETTPTAEEMIDLAQEIVNALSAAQPGRSGPRVRHF